MDRGRLSQHYCRAEPCVVRILKRGCESRLPALILGGASPGEPLEVNSRSCCYSKYLLKSNNICRYYIPYFDVSSTNYRIPD